jgi:hypothetical protein
MLESSDKNVEERERESEREREEPVITERLTRTGNYWAAAVGNTERRGRGFMNKLRT